MRKKKLWLIRTLAAALILSAAVPVCPSLAAEDSEYTETYDDTGEDTAEDSGEETEYIPESYYWTVESNEISGWPGGPQIEAEAAVVMDADTGAFLYSKNMDRKEYPASITKIMTAMLALQSGKLNDTVTITQDNVTLEDGSQVCGFVAGDQVTLDQLLHCLLVYSGNDAASAIAEYVGGSTENFVQMMNDYAAKLGCTGTHFSNPHGLQDENHYTTPYDIYLMLNEAFTYPEFTEITELPSYTVTYTGSDGTEKSTTLTATDHYLTGEATAPKDVTILGGKTGTTEVAGNCLAILTQNAYGKTFVSIVMGAATKELLYQEMNSLLQNINS